MIFKELYFKDIATRYNNKWQYPNCIGSLDGKHIRIKKPTKSGSVFYNYKGYYSVILFALAGPDHEYVFKFIIVLNIPYFKSL